MEDQKVLFYYQGHWCSNEILALQKELVSEKLIGEVHWNAKASGR